MADKSTASEPEAQKVLIRVDQAFQHSGADFAAGNYYRVEDTPTNFVDWHIKHNKRGAVVEEKDVPSGTEVQDDPRPAARKAVEEARVAVHPGPAPEKKGNLTARASLAARGQPEAVTSTENVVGQTHTAEGSHPGGRLGEAPGAPSTASSGPSHDADAPTAAAAAGDDGRSARRPRV